MEKIDTNEIKKLKLEELNRLTIEEFKESEKFPFVVILDSIRSMNNVGSAFRTCDAFNATKLYLCGITAQPPHREIEKTAIGATNSVAWEHHENIEELILKLKDNDYVIVGIEQTNSPNYLQDFVPDKNKKYAFIVGNEVFGVSDEALQLCDFCIEIPQFGTKHSLNVSVSMGVVCWHYIKSIL